MGAEDFSEGKIRSGTSLSGIKMDDLSLIVDCTIEKLNNIGVEHWSNSQLGQLDKNRTGRW
jgi:hypothetical protein